MPDDVFQATRQLFDPGSLCVRVTRASYVEELWSPSLVAPLQKFAR
jgi:hypothetical protein